MCNYMFEMRAVAGCEDPEVVLLAVTPLVAVATVSCFRVEGEREGGPGVGERGEVSGQNGLIPCPSDPAGF